MIELTGYKKRGEKMEMWVMTYGCKKNKKNNGHYKSKNKIML